MTAETIEAIVKATLYQISNPTKTKAKKTFEEEVQEQKLRLELKYAKRVLKLKK